MLTVYSDVTDDRLYIFVTPVHHKASQKRKHGTLSDTMSKCWWLQFLYELFSNVILHLLSFHPLRKKLEKNLKKKNNFDLKCQKT